MFPLILIITLLPTSNAICSQGASLHEHAGFYWDNSVKFFEDSSFLDLVLLPLGQDLAAIALINKSNSSIELKTFYPQRLNKNILLFGGITEGSFHSFNRIEAYKCGSCKPDTFYVVVFGDERTGFFSVQRNSNMLLRYLEPSIDLHIWSHPDEAEKILVARLGPAQVALYYSRDSFVTLVLTANQTVPGAVSLRMFHIQSTTFLAVGSDSKDYGGKITIFRLIEEKLVLFQTLGCPGASLLTHFMLEEDYFLVTGIKAGASRDPVVIYKFVEGYFIPLHQLLVNSPTKILPAGNNKNFLLVISTVQEGLKTFQYDGWKFIETQGEPSMTEIVSMHQSMSIDTLTILQDTKDGAKILILKPKFRNHTRSTEINCGTFKYLFKITSEISSIFSGKTKVKFTGSSKSDISLEESYLRVVTYLTNALRSAGVQIRINSNSIQNLTNISPHHEILRSMFQGATTSMVYNHIQNLMKTEAVTYGVAYTEVYGVDFFENAPIKVDLGVRSVFQGIQGAFYVTDRMNSTVALLIYNTTSLVQLNWNKTENVFQKRSKGSFRKEVKYVTSIELLEGRGFALLDENYERQVFCRIFKLEGDDLRSLFNIRVKTNTSFILGVPVANESCFMTESQEKCDIFCPTSRKIYRDFSCGPIKEAQMILGSNSTDIMILKSQKPASELTIWSFSLQKPKFLQSLHFEAGIDSFTSFKDGVATYLALQSDKHVYVYRKYYDSYALIENFLAESSYLGSGFISTKGIALYYFQPLKDSLAGCNLIDSLSGPENFITLKCQETYVISSIYFIHHL